MALLNFTDNNFQREVLEANQLVLVDFWASWCGPCQMIAPLIEETTEEYLGRMKVGKLNIEENPEIPSRYGVMSMPTLIFFKNGQPVDQLVGAMSKSNLKEKIEGNLNFHT
ncbi:MAG: thioredoxin [Candidatus Omnitrophota bacterium]|nr:MAG: thioredoxin [Candidatus Omnitrophota bacterium]